MKNLKEFELSIKENGKVFNYKNKNYKVIEIVEMKKVTGWVPAVLYKDLNGKKFVRDFLEFIRKFKSGAVNYDNDNSYQNIR